MQAINLGVLLASAVLLAGFFSSGLIETRLLLVSVVAIGPALAGVAAGQRLQRHLEPQALRRGILVVLGLAGIGLIVR